MITPHDLVIQLDEQTRKELEEIAACRHIDLPRLARAVLRDYAQARRLAECDKEKRAFPRKETAIPAIAHISGSAGVTPYISGVVQDLSFNGVRISFPREIFNAVESQDGPLTFELLFTPPTEKTSVCFACAIRRMHTADNAMDVGAEFVRSDYRDCALLQRHLARI